MEFFICLDFYQNILFQHKFLTKKPVEAMLMSCQEMGLEKCGEYFIRFINPYPAIHHCNGNGKPIGYISEIKLLCI